MYIETSNRHSCPCAVLITQVALSLSSLASVLSSQKKYEEALPLNIRAVALAREWWGTSHLNTIIFIHNLGTVELWLQMYGEAESSFREVIELMSNVIPETHPLNAHPHMRLGDLLTITGRVTEAEAHLRRALDLRVNANSAPVDIAQVQYYLGINLKKQSRFEEAETLLRYALQTRTDVFGEDHEDVLRTKSHLDDLLAKSGQMNADQ